MPQYRKKPVVIEAMQWAGNNQDEINSFIGLSDNPITAQHAYGKDGLLYIKTLEGVMTAVSGDYIIRGVKGEFYPCKPDIFAATYESVAHD